MPAQSAQTPPRGAYGGVAGPKSAPAEYLKSAREQLIKMNSARGLKIPPHPRTSIATTLAGAPRS